MNSYSWFWFSKKIYQNEDYGFSSNLNLEMRLLKNSLNQKRVLDYFMWVRKASYKGLSRKIWDINLKHGLHLNFSILIFKSKLWSLTSSLLVKWWYISIYLLFFIFICNEKYFTNFSFIMSIYILFLVCICHTQW